MPPRRLAVWLLAVSLLAGPAPAAAATSTIVQVGRRAGPVIPPDFLGLAFEYQGALAYLAAPNGAEPVIEQLVRNLAPGGRPIVRLGGHSADQTYLSAPASAVRRRAGLRYPLTPGYIASLGRFIRDVGGRLMLGINLEAGDPALARDEARALVAGVGRRWIRSLQLGNEPSLYSAFAWYRSAQGRRVFGRPPSWSVPDYLRQYAQIARGLPALPLAGPDLGDATWMGQLDAMLRGSLHVSEVTFHRYAGNACFGQPGTPYFSSVANLLNPVTSRGLADTVRDYVPIARRHGAGFRVDEFGTEACGGKAGVSDTFASALWELDALFAMAAVGVDGVNVQTFSGSPYQVFAARGAGVEVFPDYYGLLMFAQAAPAGSRIVPVAVPAGTEPWLRAWATRASDGTVRVLLLNDSPARRHTVEFASPPPGTFTAERLLAPSVYARGDVTLGGQSFGALTSTGHLAGPPRPMLLRPRSGRVPVVLPSGSATLLTVR